MCVSIEKCIDILTMHVNGSMARSILESTSVRSFENLNLVSINAKTGYSLVDLTFMKLMIVIREKMGYRNFNFATKFLYIKQELDFENTDLILYLDSGLILIPSVNNDIRDICQEWLLPTEQLVFSTEVNRDKLMELLNVSNIFGCENSILILPIYRIRESIIQKLKCISYQLQMPLEL
jgi:hypothetical protein